MFDRAEVKQLIIDAIWEWADLAHDVRHEDGETEDTLRQEVEDFAELLLQAKGK